jgi:hypothetical protein
MNVLGAAEVTRLGQADHRARIERAGDGGSIGIRPEHVLVGEAAQGRPDAFVAEVVEADVAGADVHLVVAYGGVELTARVPTGGTVPVRGAVDVALPSTRLYAFSADGATVAFADPDAAAGA